MDALPITALTQGLVSLVGTRVPRAAARFYPDILFHAPTDSKEAYLTFDDGPNPGCTESLLEVLDRHRASAIFFLLGRQADAHPQLVRKIQSAGHEIGNHSYTHPDAWRSPRVKVLDELDRATAVLEDITGEPIRIMRPPYGRFTRAMRDWCERRGQRMAMWDVGPGDYLEGMPEQAIVQQVEAHVRPGSVIVLHDNPRCAEKTPAALARVLDRLADDGWSFPPLPPG